MKQHDADITIFGAGPAGIAAAVTAARMGGRVLLVERKDKIGGVMTSCPGMMLGGGYPCGKSIGGFFEEFVSRMIKAEPPIAERRRCSLENFGDEVVYSHEPAIALLYEMLAESGVTVYVERTVDTVHMMDKRIQAVDIISTQGREKLSSSLFIDCTGNGDIAVNAGVPYQLGNQDQKMMGVTLTFMMEGVDWAQAFSENGDPYFTSQAAMGISQGRLHPTIPQIYMLKGFHEGSVFFNTVTVTGVDGTDPDSVLKGTNEARARVLSLATFCRNSLPGFEHARLSQVASSVGVRETRKLEGMYQLSYADIAEAVKFEDGIVACDNPLDEVFRDSSETHYSHEAALVKGRYYTIPFRSLVPKAVTNLLFAGRNLSVDEKAFASVRGMPQCMLMGQAAGIGAGLAWKNHESVQDLDTNIVVDLLVQQNVHGIGGRPL